MSEIVQKVGEITDRQKKKRFIGQMSCNKRPFRQLKCK